MNESLKRPSTRVVSLAVGKVTFLEVVRDKVLYNILVSAFFLFSIGFLASRLSYARPERVVLDFGLFAVSISCAIIAVFIGSGLLIKEFDRRTIYVALCHPISRNQFILGKFLGITAVLVSNWVLLMIAYLIVLGLSSDQGFAMISGTLFIALGLILIQSLVLASIAILFSTFSTVSLSAMMTIGFYLMGNNVSQIHLLASKLTSSVSKFFLNSVATLIPNLEYFNLGHQVTYQLPVLWQSVCLSFLYGAFVIALVLALAGVLVQSREV